MPNIVLVVSRFALAGQEIPNALVVDFKVLRFHRVAPALVLQMLGSFKDLLNRPRNHAHHFWVVDLVGRSLHPESRDKIKPISQYHNIEAVRNQRKRLATSSLSVSKDADVVAVERRLNQLRNIFEDLALLGI